MPDYRDLPWSAIAGELGSFVLIIGSDILYLRGQSAPLAGLADCFANARAEIATSDPGRGNGGRMTCALIAQGYRAESDRRAIHADEHAPFCGRVLRFSGGVGPPPPSEGFAQTGPTRGNCFRIVNGH